VAAPAYLSGSAAAIWEAHEREYDLALASARELFETYVQESALAKDAEAKVQEDGLMIFINDGKTEVAHPLIRVAHTARSLAMKAEKELNLRFAARNAAGKAKAAGRDTVKSPRVSE
jgi:phage terminase small subunit